MTRAAHPPTPEELLLVGVAEWSHNSRRGPCPIRVLRYRCRRLDAATFDTALDRARRLQLVDELMLEDDTGTLTSYLKLTRAGWSALAAGVAECLHGATA